MLIGAGILIASGAVPVWFLVPLAYLAVVGGVLTGYLWAHRIGPRRVHALAVRLHAGGPYDRAAARLRTATPLQIGVSRLLPGLRVYTSLVAGAVGLKLNRFMIGVLPASALWLVAFIGLGFFVGAPVERLLNPFVAYALRAVVVALVVVVWVVAARRMPAADPPAAAVLRHGRWRLPLAFGVDLSAVSCVAAALSLLTLVATDFSRLAFSATVFATLGVLYLVVARQTVGYTLGEALMGIRYYRPRPPRLLQRH